MTNVIALLVRFSVVNVLFVLPQFSPVWRARSAIPVSFFSLREILNAHNSDNSQILTDQNIYPIVFILIAN